MVVKALLDSWLMPEDRLTAEEWTLAKALSAKIDEMLNEYPDFEVPWANRLKKLQHRHSDGCKSRACGRCRSSARTD